MEKVKIYSKLSEEYNKLFAENILQFQKNGIGTLQAEAKYTSFYPSFGIKEGEKCKFLIYGQAADTWGKTFTIETNQSEIINDIDKCINYSNEYYEAKDHSPLDWVNVFWSNRTYADYAQLKEEKPFYEEMKYRTSRSFFWRVTYKLISDYYNFDRESWEWSKKLIWSNLYKIAPTNDNPNDIECSNQEKCAIQLVKKEIEEINPEYCIILTNGDWWLPFQNELRPEKIASENLPSKIVYFEKYNNTKIIVTTRPFWGGGEKHVEQILQLIRE